VRIGRLSLNRATACAPSTPHKHFTSTPGPSLIFQALVTAPKILRTTCASNSSSIVPQKPLPLIALLTDFQRACAELNVGWYLFGAQAALLYGSPRLTADADLTVQLGPVATDTFARALEQNGFELRVADPAFVRMTRVLPIVHRVTAFPADVVLGGPGLEEAFLKRAKLRVLHGLPVPVAAVEDLIVMKVLAGRRKDEEDVAAMLSAQGEKLDLAVIRETLRALSEALAQDDLLPLFERLLAEATNG